MDEIVYQPQKTDYFQGKFNLRKAGIEIPYSQYQLDEIRKCKEPKTGIHYFFKTYLKTLSLDSGQWVLFEPRPYQTTMINMMMENRFNIFMNPRQSGKTTVTSGVYTYLMNFFPYEICGIVANKEKTAFEIISTMQKMFQGLPFWMQQGVVSWQSGGFELENGSRSISAATSKDALSGFPIKNLYWDECFLGNTVITVRNKKTGIVENIKMSDFANRLIGTTHLVFIK
jgi:hypothetical protein